MSDEAATMPDPEQEAAITAFWTDVRHHAQLSAAPGYFGESGLEALQPPAWSFGGTPEEADVLLQLVRDGTKTATAGALWDYEAAEEPLPSVGNLAIVLDGAGEPRALIVTRAVDVVPFDQVSEEFARLEGEGDRSLEHWRREHERFFTESAVHDKGFSPQMPVVCEVFELIWPKPD